MKSSLAAAKEIERERDDHQNFNDDLENNDSDEDDDQFFVDDEEEFSSPSTNSDGMQFNNNPWYAYRGRINLFENREIAPEIPLIQPQQQPLIQAEPLQQQQQQQDQNEEEEETDFLEMDFEPENSEIENENEMINGHNHNINHINGNCEHHQDNHIQQQQALENFNHYLPHSSSQNYQQINNNQQLNEPSSSSSTNNHQQQQYKYTGAKPKILKQPLADSRCQKPVKQRHVTEGDQIFKITGHLSTSNDRYCDDQPSCSSTINNRNESSSYHFDSPSTSSNSSNFFNSKPHKSPMKSCHSSHKQKQELFEKQSNQFLFEIDPIRPRNSVTIYTSNCDEKILMDALVRFNFFS